MKAGALYVVSIIALRHYFLVDVIIVIVVTVYNALLCPTPNSRGIKRCFCLTSVCLSVCLSVCMSVCLSACLSDVCLSVAYIGLMSRTERPRKTKIGTGVAHVTRDSDTTFKVTRSKVKVTRPLYSTRP